MRVLPGIQDGYNRKGLVSEEGEKKLAFVCFVLVRVARLTDCVFGRRAGPSTRPEAQGDYARRMAITFSATRSIPKSTKVRVASSPPMRWRPVLRHSGRPTLVGRLRREAGDPPFTRMASAPRLIGIGDAADVDTDAVRRAA